MISYGNELKRRSLAIRPSSIHGFGVFAKEAIAASQVIEECIVLISDIPCQPFGDYFFSVAKKRGLALGCGSLYNHSDTPNADYIFDVERSILVFFTLRNIAQGEEILVSYGPNWFEDRKIPIKKPSWRYRVRHWKSLGLICRFLVVALGLALFLQCLNILVRHH